MPEIFMPTPVAATGNHLRPEPPRLEAPLSVAADSVWSHRHHPVSPPSHHQQQQSTLRLPEVKYGGGGGGGCGGGGGGCSSGGTRQEAPVKLTEATNGVVKKKKKKKKKRWSSQPNFKKQGQWKKLLWVKQDCMTPLPSLREEPLASRMGFLTDYSCRPG